jgi:pyruvate formate lyase activating enzyme
MTKEGLIFDIKRYSINDGPGIRVTIFFKGCPLRCAWCHNPESFSKQVQKLYTESRCIGARECIAICPNGALTLTTKGIVTDGYKCNLCGKCAEACPTKAIEMSGRLYSSNEIMKAIEKEELLFDQSGGGVTFSGGEPMLHYDFLIELLDACRQREYHRCVDTSGQTDTHKLLEVAKNTDLFLYDLKLMDAERHKKFTGVTNEKILYNLQQLSKTGAMINIRIPFIGNVNTDEENIEASAFFIASLEGEKKEVNLLPYHNIAAHKYTKMGSLYHNGEMREPSKEEIERAINLFAKYNIEVTIGG